jgi:tRNA (guanine-N7-)-methyltransferase
VASDTAGALPAVAPSHPLRPIRTFVRRGGRATDGQLRAFANVGPRVILPYQAPTEGQDRFDPRAAFAAPTHPLVLEIGFGMGEATAQIAATLAGTNFLCCEVHEAGVGALLKRIDAQQLTNIRIVAHDAVEVVDHMLPVWQAEQPEVGLDGIHIFFPDPWHKKRHHKRRLIQAPLVARLVQRLKPGAYLHCATDWEPYAQQILSVLSQEPMLRNTSTEDHGFADKPPYRPLTKFENRGLKLGHGVWDIVFHRR